MTEQPQATERALANVVPNKYRGKAVYHLVYAELIAAAQYQGVTTYQDLAGIMGLPLRGNLMGFETGYILGEISEDEGRAGRPMLSAVAVDVNGRAGPGFFKLARQLNRLSADGDETAFWESERKAVYATWKRALRTSHRTAKDAP